MLSLYCSHILRICPKALSMPFLAPSVQPLISEGGRS